MTSIVVQIVTYNSADDMQVCLDSVFAQTYPIEKVIVIDNNSQDNIKEVIALYPQVYFVSNKINNGFVGGHNQAIGYADSDYVLVLNPDVILEPGYIELILNYMLQNQNIGAATGKLYRDMQLRNIDSTGIDIKKNRRAVDRGSGEVDQGQYDEARVVFGVSGAAAIYKRAMIDAISTEGQFFDESFFAYKEDVDVSWRARLAGWEICFVPEAIAQHERGWKDRQSRKNISLKTRRHSYINRHFYMIKNDRFLYFLLYSPIICLYELTCLAYLIVKEPRLISAYLLLLKEYKALKKKRKWIQGNSQVPSIQIYKYFKGIW